MDILGVDVSEYQGLMDWPKCKAAGAGFGYFRVGNGPDDVDDQFERNKVLAPAVLPTGGYWAFHPDWSGTVQADSFCDLLSTFNWKMPPWIDVELKGVVASSTRTKRLEDFVLRMIQRLRILPVIYTRAEWFNVNIYRRVLWSCCDLAVARYTNIDHPWGDGYCKPKDWTDFTFWQWSADGNGRGKEFGAQSANIDLDWYTGALPGTGQVTIKQPAWLRSRPAEASSQVAASWEGGAFDVVGRQEDWVKVAAWVKTTDIR